MVAGKKILAESLGAFQLGGGLTGAKDFQTGSLKAIHNTQHQRYLWPHNGQAHIILQGKVTQAFDIFNLDGDILQLVLAGGARITGGHKNRIGQRRLSRLPGQCMFAATAADNQNIHLWCLLLVVF